MRKAAPRRVVPGETGIYLAPNGGGFQVQLSYRGANVHVGTFPDLATARTRREAKLLALKGGLPHVPVTDQTTPVGAFFEVYLARYYGVRSGAAKGPKPSGIRSARARWNVYLREPFGILALCDVSEVTILDFYRELCAKRPPKERRGTKRPGCSDKTKREVLILLKSILDAAVQERLLNRSPFPAMKLPSARRAELTFPSFSEAQEVCRAIGEPTYRLLAWTLLLSGVRLGEALALRWEHVQFKAHELRVATSADALTREVGDPKSAHGVRAVPLHPSLAELLAEHRAAQEAGGRPSANGWVFVSPLRRRTKHLEAPPIIDQRNFCERHFLPARDAVLPGTTFTPHSFRHTWCAEMVQRHPVADVAKWAGHHDASFTFRVYVSSAGRAGDAAGSLATSLPVAALDPPESPAPQKARRKPPPSPTHEGGSK